MTALLQLDEVHAAYGSIKALHGVSISVPVGEVVALLGANGAGKTTTLRAISGTVRRWGQVLYDGADIGGRSTEQVAGLGIAHVPEGRGTMGAFTVQENLVLGAYANNRKRQQESLDRVYSYFPVLAQRRTQAATGKAGIRSTQLCNMAAMNGVAIIANNGILRMLSSAPCVQTAMRIGAR